MKGGVLDSSPKAADKNERRLVNRFISPPNGELEMAEMALDHDASANHILRLGHLAVLEILSRQLRLLLLLILFVVFCYRYRLTAAWKDVFIYFYGEQQYTW